MIMNPIPTAQNPGDPARERRESIDPDQAWSQVLARDPAAAFVYAVRTTGVFCRPTCPSRRPTLANVAFYCDADEALAAGFRPCLRCSPTQPSSGQDAGLVEKVCEYLRRNVHRAVTLEQLGRLSGMTPMSLQKKFRQVLGMTPRQFQIAHRTSGFRALVNSGTAMPTDPATVTDALYDAGYSGSSRLYTDAPRTLGMTPARFRDGGRGEAIVFVTAPCALGHVLVAATEIGICSVTLGDAPDLLEAGLRQRFHRARSLRSLDDGNAADAERAGLLQAALSIVLSQLTDHPTAGSLPLDLRATVFQQRVWQALAAIPRGQTRSYHQVAQELGQPTASRAVARACASNPVALLVPCHRVIGTDGSLSGYRWGLERKRSMLAIENRAIDRGAR